MLFLVDGGGSGSGSAEMHLCAKMSFWKRMKMTDSDKVKVI